MKYWLYEKNSNACGIVPSKTYKILRPKKKEKSDTSKKLTVSKKSTVFVLSRVDRFPENGTLVEICGV